MNVKLTEGELEILQVIWKNGQCSVRDVHDELKKYKVSGYTTTLKIMQIMNEKGLVKRDTTFKTHQYIAVIDYKQVQNTALDKIINTVFKGSTMELVLQALGQHRASKEEISEIRNYLEKFDGYKKA